MDTNGHWRLYYDNGTSLCSTIFLKTVLFNLYVRYVSWRLIRYINIFQNLIWWNIEIPLLFASYYINISCFIIRVYILE